VANFHKSTMIAVRKDIEAALQSIGKKHNVEFKVGSIGYSANEAKIKLHMYAVQEDGEVYDPKADDFKNFAGLFGLKASDFGRSFTSGRKVYTICGLDRNARKYPVLAKDESGVVYKFETAMVTPLLK
jgi:hypothetical protein